MAIVPGTTELTAPYWDAARDGRLVVQECHVCRQVWHPPLHRCPHCHSGDLGWREVSGAGTVYTYTVVRHPTHFAFADKIPYILAMVELAEGPRLITALTGIEPGEVQVGQAVHAVFREVADGVTLPYFEPG
ncbi:MAG TPA: Zn-ribbon domain-containing OB-fold protein [Trebonia sp.]|nr:Zn-ribbon domain-containing OB-fold protein [Trebonia sp.]